MVVVRQLAHFLDGGSHVARLEKGRARHKRVRASAGTFGCGLRINAAIHFQPVF